MAVKTLSTNRYSQLRLNSTNIIPASAYNVVVVPAPPSVAYLIVAGGGSGANAGGAGAAAAGGGAGGLLACSAFSVASTVTYVITVGAGGPGIPGTTRANGTTGSNSILSGGPVVTAFGGGAGGAYGVTGGGNGGSGGGGAYSYGPGLGTVGPPRQGYDGGGGGVPSAYTSGGGTTGGGGGGAGAPGTAAIGNVAGTGAGGAGTFTSIISTATAISAGVGQVTSGTVWFAGGGGGGGYTGGYIVGTGGTGGGGAGGPATTAATSGTIYTGGGGGGTGCAAATVTLYPGGGGSGVVILSHPTTYATGVVTGSPKIATNGTSTVYIFTASGTIQFLLGSGSVAPAAPIWPISILSGTAVNTQLVSTGTTALTYTLVAGTSLPAGVTLSTTGLLSGTASVGIYTFSVSVNDLFSQTVTQAITLTVVANLVTGMTVNSVYVTDSSYVALTPTRSAVSTSGGYLSIIGTGFTPSNKVYVQGIPATTSTYVSATQINAQLPAYSTSSQSVQQIYVVNTLTNSAGILITGFLYSVMPYWTISSSQALVGPAISASLAALSDSSLVYSISSGTLPSGLTLNTSTGLISGTVSVETSTSVVILATDLETQTNTQTFTLSIIISDPNLMYNTLLLNGETTVKPFNADASTSSFEVAVFGDTRPNNFNPYTNGYYSNYFGGSPVIILGTAASTAVNALATKPLVTMECWIMTTAIQAITAYGSAVFGQAPALSQNGRYEIELIGSSTTSPQTVGFWWTTGPGAAASVATVATINQNSWNHIAITLDMTTPASTTIKIYINGVGETFTGKDLSSHTADNTNPTYIGGAYGSGYQSMTGYISNFRFSKGLIYTTNFTPSTAPLTANTNTVLLTCQSPRFVDAGPNAYSMTLSGSPTIQSYVPFASTSTVSVPTIYSTKFNGTTDYLTVPSNSALDFPTGDFTIEMWIYPTAAGQFLGKDGAYAVAFPQYDFQITAGNKLQFSAGAGNQSGTASTAYVGTTNVTYNAWHHVAAVRTGTTIKVFLDGNQEVSTAQGVAMVSGGRTLDIAVNRASSLIYWSGFISNLRITKGTALYTASFTPSTAPLTATTGTVLLTCQSSTLIDNSTGTFTITSVGSAQPVASTPFTQTYSSQAVSTLGSGYFDGTGDYLIVTTATSNITLTADFTIDMWIYPTNVTGSFSLLALGTEATSRYVIIITNGALVTNIFGSGSVTMGGTIAINAWTHVSVIRSGTTIRGYLNGVVLGTTDTNAATLGNNGPVRVGSDASGATTFIGYMSNVRIIRGQALYTANFAPPTAPLTATTATSLLTLQSNQAVNNSQFLDMSSNSLVITRNGDTNVGTFAPFGASWSNFNPNSDNGIGVATNAALNMGTGDFTVEAWVNTAQLPTSNTFTTSAGGYQAVFATGPNNAATGSQLYIGVTNLFFDIASDGGGPINIAHNMLAGQWYHVAITRSGTTFRAFINGSLVQTATSSASWVDGYGVGVMRAEPIGGYGGAFWYGYVSNFRMVKGGALYTASFTPSTTPLTPSVSTGTVALLVCQSPAFQDNSANAFALTLGGTPKVQRFSPFANYLQTPQSYSTKFNGTTDYLTLPSGNPALQFTSSDFTLEAWVYPLTFVANGNPIFALDVNGSWYASVRFGYESAGAISVAMSTTGAAWALTVSSGIGTVALNIWQHVALSRSGTSVRVFLNGVQQGATQTVSGSLMTSTNNWIGYLNAPSAQFVNGYISNARIIKGTALYTANFTPSTTPLTATTSTSLLTLQDATIKDNSTSTFTLTATGGPTPYQFNPFGYTTSSKQSYTPAVYGGSAYFDGTGDYLTVGATSFPSGGTTWTIEGWIYITTITSVVAFAGIGDLITVQIMSSGTTLNVSYRHTPASAVWADLGWNYTFKASNWYHIAAVLNSGSMKAYVNGINLGTPANGTPTGIGAGANGGTGAGVLWIGAYDAYPFNSVDAYTNGYISNFRITSTAVYTNNFVPPAAPTTAIANTTLLLGNNPAIADFSMQNNLESFGDAKISTAVKKYNNASLYFDGTGDYLSSSDNLTLAFGSGAFTVEGWIYLTNTSGTKGIMFGRGSNSFGLRIGQSYLGNVNGLNIAKSGIADLDYCAFTFATNTWYHIAVVRSSTTIYFFVNGTQQTTQGSGAGSFSFVNPTSGFYIGCNNDTNEQFAGYIDDFRITKGVARYTANFTTATSAVLTL